MANKYKGKPNLFYNDMIEAAEYLREIETPEPVERLPELLYAIGCKYSEEGSTTEQDSFINDVQSI